MSEKRLKFTLDSDRQYIGIFDEGYALTGFEVCNFLNSLYQQCEALQDENEQLKFENETLKSNYQREIQSSIDFCNAYSKTNGELLEKIEKLEKENEMLKEENEQLRKQINEYNLILKQHEFAEKEGFK